MNVIKSLIKKTQKNFIKKKIEISLIGSPNVGKSTLFNNLINEKESLVHPTPGLTRDCKNTKIHNVLDIPIVINDTPGLNLYKKYLNNIEFQMKEMVEKNINQSDIIFFLVDAKHGTTKADYFIRDWLLKNFDDKNIVLLGNKSDDEFIEMNAYNDLYSFWKKDIIFISAIEGNNIHSIWEKIKDNINKEDSENYKEILKKRKKIIKDFKKDLEKTYKNYAKDNKEFDIKEHLNEFDTLNRDIIYNSDIENEEIPIKNKFLLPKYETKSGISYDNKYKNLPLTISIIGRPNSGKSTLVNNLLKKNMVITDSQKHTTRDPIELSTNFRGRRIILMDTAGLDRNLIKDRKSIDAMIFYRNINKIKNSQIHIILVDALNAFRVKDLDIIQNSVKEGRGTIVIVNKWDLIDEKFYNKAIKYIKNQLKDNLGSEKSVPILFANSLNGKGLNDLQDIILNIYENWNIRVSTGLLNDWLKRFKKLCENDYKSMIKENVIMNLLYVTQIKTRPPTFAFFVNDIRFFKKNMTKFFKARLVEEFKLYGVPVKIVYRGVKHKHFIKKLQSMDRNK